MDFTSIMSESDVPVEVKWIPVEKSRPDNLVPVLVAMQNDADVYDILVFKRVGDAWIDSFEGRLLHPEQGKITHWMPLPKSP